MPQCGPVFQCIIYKILAGVLARRFRQWIMDNGVISPCQKGFLSYDGCFEHNFLLRSVVEDSKRRNKNVRITSLEGPEGVHPVLCRRSLLGR